MTLLIVECPWCGGGVEVEQRNCGIFRHGINKQTGKQIDSHAKKEAIELLKERNSLIGCGNPFRLTDDNTPEKCDYI